MNGSKPVQTLVCRKRGLLMLILSRVHKGLDVHIGQQEVHTSSVGNEYTCTTSCRTSNHVVKFLCLGGGGEGGGGGEWNNRS